MNNLPPHLQNVPTWVRRLSAWILRRFGWQVVGDLAAFPKAVIIAAPHTTNWDGPLTFLAGFSTGARFRWMGKASLFRWPFRPISFLLGGMPIDRSKSRNVVQQCIDLYNSHDSLFIILAPEGTRHYAEYWRTGFYRIAEGAKLPIIMGKIDYTRKTIDISAHMIPSGDIMADMDIFRAAYQGWHGKNPDQFGPIRLKDEGSQS